MNIPDLARLSRNPHIVPYYLHDEKDFRNDVNSYHWLVRENRERHNPPDKDLVVSSLIKATDEH
jgi:hypothetical protein